MSQASFKNKLIRKFSEGDYESLRPHFETVELNIRDVLVRPNVQVESIYFPESGQILTLAKVPGSEPIEAGMIGCEGMSELALSGRSPIESITQLSGKATRLPWKIFTDTVRQSAPLATLMLHYQNALTLQIAYTALSHGSFTVPERLARWLLMVDDRADGHDIPLVHDFFSWMLAVRRAGVSEAMKHLVEQGAITTARGKVRISDRDKLIDLASGSYGPAEAEYERIFSGP